MVESFSVRLEPRPSDRSAVETLVRATGFFSPAEIDIAIELVDEALVRGAVASGYSFLFAERENRVSAYACYGPIAGTAGSYDLYWIVVDPTLQGQGVGRWLLGRVESEIRREGGQRVWVDTSERPQYETTRSFYRKCGYEKAASLPDFYAEGDGKAIFVKMLPHAE